MADQDDSEDDRVGYKKPPKERRYIKGKSGNAGGRPKKRALDSDDRLIALVEAKVSNSDNTVHDLLLKAAIKAGVQNGDMKAVRFVYDSYLLAKRRRLSTTTDDEGDRAIVEALLGADHPLVKDIVDELSESENDGEPVDGKPKSDG